MKIKRCLLLGSTMLLLFQSFVASAMAGDRLDKGRIGVTIDAQRRLFVKSMISDQVAIAAGILLFGNDRSSNGYDEVRSSFTLGVRKYDKKGSLDAFYDLCLEYTYSDHTADNAVPSSYWEETTELQLRYGLEHFVSENVSVEGGVGADIGYEKSSYGKDSKYIALPVTSLGITYYW